MESAPTFFAGAERDAFFPVACVGATIGRPPTYRRNAFSGTVVLQGKRARASNARPYKSFSTVCAEGSHMGTLGVLHFMLFDCPVNSITRLTAMHRSQPLFQHIVQLFDQACEEARNKSDQFEKAGYPG